MNGWASENALGKIMKFLMTELWDQSFSQTEIREAFDASVADMNRSRGAKNAVHEILASEIEIDETAILTSEIPRFIRS